MNRIERLWWLWILLGFIGLPLVGFVVVGAGLDGPPPISLSVCIMLGAATSPMVVGLGGLTLIVARAFLRWLIR